MLQRRTSRALLTEMARPAVVFAPHPDDETLGCGGTIIKKRRAGAPVDLVFMTDGSRSHAHLMPPEALKETRMDEARAAAEALGVPPDRVHFLGYEDRHLADAHEAAVAEVENLVRQARPEDVFLPYRHDITPDHIATYRIVRAALRAYRTPLTVYEYAIWYWYQWPRLPLPIGWDRPALQRLLHTLYRGFGVRALWDFNAACYVEDALEAKRHALDQHASQMTRLTPDTNWPVLADVADGDFLACFLAPYEWFRRSSINRSTP
jgi:LmbE family N-acetylglucosaminyl deacetylase